MKKEDGTSSYTDARISLEAPIETIRKNVDIPTEKTEKIKSKHYKEMYLKTDWYYSYIYVVTDKGYNITIRTSLGQNRGNYIYAKDFIEQGM